MLRKIWLVKGSKHRSFPLTIADDLRPYCNILLDALKRWRFSAVGYYLRQCTTKSSCRK
jgi:hypothetical protein